MILAFHNTAVHRASPFRLLMVLFAVMGAVFDQPKDDRHEEEHPQQVAVVGLVVGPRRMVSPQWSIVRMIVHSCRLLSSVCSS